MDRDCGWSDSGETVDAACKTCNNRQCVPCVSGTTWSSSGTDKKGAAGIKCTAITQCCAASAAAGIKFTGSANADRTCVDCGAGKFSTSGTDGLGDCCGACATCAETAKYYSKTCTKTQNAECGTPPACCTGKLTGYSWGTHTAVGAAGTCAACVAGTSFSASGTEAAGACCAACADCTATDKFYATACTTTATSTCGDKAVCCATGAAVTGFLVGTKSAAGSAGTCAACGFGKWSADGFDKVGGGCCAACTDCSATDKFYATTCTTTATSTCGDKATCCAGATVVDFSVGSLTTAGSAGKCPACAAGKFSASGFETTGACCADHKTCNAATEYVATLGTDKTDVVCTAKATCCSDAAVIGFLPGSASTVGAAGTCKPCAAGTKFSASGLDANAACCAACTDCSATDKFYATTCTTTATSTCGDKATCCAGAAVVDFSVGSLTTAGSAGTCPACAAGKFSASGFETTGACCAVHTACAVDKFTSAVGTATTNTVCGDKTTCCTASGAAAVGYSAGTLTALGAAGTCVACGAGKFSASGLDANAACCADFKVCTATQWWKTLGTSKTDAVCSECSPCKINIPSAGSVNFLTVCDAGSATALGADSTCKLCPATPTPMFDTSGKPRDLTCVANKQCCVQKGEYESVKGTRSSDTTCSNCAKCNRFATACNDVLGAGTCAPCAKGTFSATATDMTDGKCVPWQACHGGEWTKTAGTTTADNVCSACTVCAKGTFPKTVCQPDADTVCVAPAGCPRATWSTEPVVAAASAAVFPAFSALVAVVLALQM